MRSHLLVLVAVAFSVIGLSLWVPKARAQVDPADIINGLNQLFNNNSNSGISGSGGGNPNSRTPPRPVGQLVQVLAGDRWQSSPFPAGTHVTVDGPGVTNANTFKLPASLVVDSNGEVVANSVVLSGTVVAIRNDSSDEVRLQFLQPSGGGSSPVSPAPTATPPNNRPSAGIGDVVVKNLSGGTVRVTYKLPTGKRYSVRGNLHSEVYFDLRSGRTDETPDIAENTRVTFEGYVDEFYLDRNTTLMLTIHNNYVGSQVVPQAAPSPGSPVAPLTPANPLPNPSPGSNSNPLPPAPGPVATVPQNTIPTARTMPLTSEVAVGLAQRINKEVLQVLNSFDQGSTGRVAALQRELVAAGFPEDGAAAIGGAATDGDPTKIAGLFKEHRPANASVPKTMETSHLAIATFRKSFTELLTKMAAGSSAADMAANIQAVKEQATNLGAAGLADAMTLTQQDLLIRDTINGAVLSSVLSVGGSAPPAGSVTVIRHPMLDGQTSYLGLGGVIVTRSNDDRIIVQKSTAGAALGLPISNDAPVLDSKATSAPRGIIISNPSTTRTTLSYRLNGQQYNIQPNHTQPLAVGTSWQIEFSTNETNAANKKYSLKDEGTYEFVIKDGQLDLQTQEFSIRVNNPATSNTILRYTVDQILVEVPAGSSVDHKSKLPLLIQFDRGNGSSTATKLLQTKGDYYFALNRESQWELYAGEAPATVSSNADQIEISRPALASLQKNAGTMLFEFKYNVVPPRPGNGLLDLLKAAQ